MSIDEYEDYLEVNNPRIQRQIRQATREYKAGKARPAEELLK